MKTTLILSACLMVTALDASFYEGHHKFHVFLNKQGKNNSIAIKENCSGSFGRSQNGPNYNLPD